jgi:hypothetical protein
MVQGFFIEFRDVSFRGLGFESPLGSFVWGSPFSMDSCQGGDRHFGEIAPK